MGKIIVYLAIFFLGVSAAEVGKAVARIAKGLEAILSDIRDWEKECAKKKRGE